MKKKKIAILGSTGSIGRSTLDVVRQFRDRFQVVGLAAGFGFAALLVWVFGVFLPGGLPVASAELTWGVAVTALVVIVANKVANVGVMATGR